MKILFANLFCSFTSDSMVRTLRRMEHAVKEVTYYTPEDDYHDDRLYGMMEKDIRAHKPDCVMTVNIWPMQARVCHDLRVPYLAWSYDSPQNLKTNEDLDYDTNYLFIFDGSEVEKYHREGIKSVYHLPLAADTERWDKIMPPKETYDVSLLGTLYESTFPNLMRGMGEYNLGYMQAVLEAQKKIYGYFLIDDILTDELVESLNSDFQKAVPGCDYVNTRQMAFSIGTYLTYFERLSLLRLLGSRCDLHLFSKEIKEETKPLLKDLTIHPWATYEEGMPKVFKASRINLNPSLKIIRSGISLRCMDILGCGGFLLSSYQPELAEYFVPDEEVVLYDSMEDAVAKTMFYLEHEDLRKAIAARGYEKVKREFTYPKQIQKMFDTAGLK